MAKLRMNSKAVKEAVKKYIESEVENIGSLVDDFNNHNKWDYKGYHNIVDFIVSMGTYGFTVWYSEQRALLKEWLNETEAEAKVYTDEQVYKSYIHIVETVMLSMYGLRKSVKYDFRDVPHSKSYQVLEKSE
ncbi:MAG: hypothetical protein IKT89_03035 [Clostridia bacterium]|nr:hypothetical protein [Clostridia bacterium]